MAWKIGELTRLPLGYVGENSTRTIEIDVSEWLDRFPGATIVVEVVRPDRVKYFAATDLEGGILSWEISAGDVGVPGKGIAQIAAVDLDTYEIYKSRVVGTIIAESLAGFDAIELEDEDPSKRWVTRVLDAAETVRESAESAAESAELAQQAAAQNGYMHFLIEEDGRLYMWRTDNVRVVFEIDEGRLMVYEEN